jgi:hypothetical protein
VEIRDHFPRIVSAATPDSVRTAYAAFERTWAKRCPGVATSLREGGNELLTFSASQGAVILLFSLMVSGQIKLRRIDGWRKIASVLSEDAAVAA